jgi:hypothetical protein
MIYSGIIGDHTMETISFSLSIASLVTGICLSVLAIGLSVYFFVKGKETEAATLGHLTQLRSETSQLTKLNDQIMSKLIGSLTTIAEYSADSTREYTEAQQQAASKTNEQAEAGEVPDSRSTKDSSQDELADLPAGAYLSGHGIPTLVDPISVETFRHEMINATLMLMNSYGWINNYGQYALRDHVAHHSPSEDETLIREAAANLDQTSEAYKRSREFIESIKASHPEWFEGNQLAPYYESTKIRLDEFIRTYEETKAYFYLPR